MTLIKRHIDFAFELGEGDFGEKGKNKLDVPGLRASVTVTKEGGNSLATATVKAYGLSLAVMNKLSILGKPLVGVRANTITIYAYDEGAAPVDIFTGLINEAWIDGTSAPHIAFVLSAFDGLETAVKPTPPASYKGTVDLAIVVENIAKTMGKTLENSGVSVKVPNCYLHGSPLSQLQEAARWGNFNCVIEGDVVAIWPARGVRGGQPTPVNVETGLVGYPMIAETGVELVSLFNPLVSVGRSIEVKSIFERANGKWTVSRVVHDLESETPGGKWYSNISGRIFDHTEPSA